MTIAPESRSGVFSPVHCRKSVLRIFNSKIVKPQRSLVPIIKAAPAIGAGSIVMLHGVSTFLGDKGCSICKNCSSRGCQFLVAHRKKLEADENRWQGSDQMSTCGSPSDFSEFSRWLGKQSAPVRCCRLLPGYVHPVTRCISRRFSEPCRAGEAKAQVNLGVMYGTGQGVVQDNVYAHMWLNIAASTGDADAMKDRDIIA